MNKMKILTTYRSYPKGYNLTSRKDAETQSYVSNDLNQYTEIQDSQGTINPYYDDDGNFLSDGNFIYTWNGENRLIRVETTGSAALQSGLELSYDYKGRRIDKKVYENGVLSKHELFVYDGFKCIEKLEALNGNSLLQKFIWYGEKILSLNTGSDTYYYLHDANKNVSELVDDNGNIVAHYEYSPFGKVITSTGSYASENPYRFSSEYSDTETALIYYNYRYYSPELGRWLSRDPIEEKGGVSLYCFISNNPVILYDTLGLQGSKLVKQCINVFSSATETPIPTDFSKTGISEFIGTTLLNVPSSSVIANLLKPTTMGNGEIPIRTMDLYTLTNQLHISLFSNFKSVTTQNQNEEIKGLIGQRCKTEGEIRIKNLIKFKISDYNAPIQNYFWIKREEFGKPKKQISRIIGQLYVRLFSVKLKCIKCCKIPEKNPILVWGIVEEKFIKKHMIGNVEGIFIHRGFKKEVGI